MKKILIIGAGLTGCFIAHKLSHYDVEIMVIDRQNDIANETSMANSAIVHTGYDPEEGTLKAELNVKGARLYPMICSSLSCDYHPCGAFVVAKQEEKDRLEDLYQKAMRRGIKAEYLSIEEARQEEPALHEDIKHVLSIPDTAIIYPWQVAIALMEEAVLNGCQLHLHENVIGIEKKDRFIVKTDKGSYEVDDIINAAGCGAQRIAAMIEANVLYEITPKKGQYYVLSKQATNFVHHIIYPTPSKVGKGVLCVPTTHGNILLGPTSEYSDEFDVSTTQDGLSLIKEKLSGMLKNIPYEEVIRSYSGLRATGNHNDFYIAQSKEFERFIHVACIDSPGLASSPAIAEYVFDRFFNDEHLEKKTSFLQRVKPIVIKNLTFDEKQRLIQEQPGYGKIVCRCEQVSRQEIIDAIHRPCGARSIKGVKKRVRPGMGLCQGGFCEPLVASILAEELHLPLSEILYDAPQSKLGTVSKGEHHDN